MNDNGSVLITALLIMALLSVIGISAATVATTDIKISVSFRSGKEVFYIAEAGIEHAKEILRLSMKGDDFTKNLQTASGNNTKLEWDAAYSDDIPVTADKFANGQYTVYLMNDIIERQENLTDSNRQVTLRSIGAVSNGSTSILEATVRKFSMPELPAAITLLGKNSSFTGNQSKTKLLTGNEDNTCGNRSEPVFAVTGGDTLKNVQAAIDNSIPENYMTNDIWGIVQDMTDNGDLSDIKNNYNIDLTNIESIKALTANISKGADIIAPSGKGSASIDMGTDNNPKIVIVRGDFELKNDGAGILIVHGTLKFKNSVNYNGLIVVIGDGIMEISGNGRGKIRGGIILANINAPYPGPDGKMFTSDDEPGSALLDMSEGGDINISLCSSSVKKAASLIPLSTIAFLQKL